MKKIEVPLDAVCYPMPCSLVGMTVEGKANFLTVAWFSMVNFKPPCIMVALGKAHHSNKGIKANKTFSINIPSASQIEVTDYCGLVSGRKYDKAARFSLFYGKLKTAPMIEESPYNLECRLIKTVELEADEVFIGEIVAAYSEKRYLTGGMPDLRKMKPFVLAMAQQQYMGLGRALGTAWEIGKGLVKEKKGKAKGDT